MFPVADEQMVDEVEEEQVQVTKRPRNSSLHRYVCCLPAYQVRLDWLPSPCIAFALYCLHSAQQLSCLGSSVGRTSAS